MHRHKLLFAFLILSHAGFPGRCYSQQFPFGFGDIPVEEDVYQDNQFSADTLSALSDDTWDLQELAEFDARQRGWVTSPKNQGSCGSCWAFASVGAIESRILKDGGPLFDFSEQQMVSCHTGASGCCGGSGSALKFFYNNRPVTEQTASYAESSTSCPTQRTVTCAAIGGPTLPYVASGFYTVERTTAAFKTSLLTHGPSYFRYDVHSDFTTYWNSANPGDIYTNAAANRLGGHAVLLIGWSDAKHAFLCKNSWGESGGPNGDGTFWIRYDGHANDLNLQMFNLSHLTRVRDAAEAYAQSRTPVAMPTDAEAEPTPTTEGGFSVPTLYLSSLPGTVAVTAEPTTSPDTADGFSWYNNLRVNGNSILTGTDGTTQISVYARDVKWRYAFDGPAVRSPQGNGGSAGSGWRFPNAHRFGIVVYQGGRYWNVSSSSSVSPTVITGLSNTQPIRITVNDTSGNYEDNGGAFDIYVRKDN